MVGCVNRFFLVMCLVLLERAQARVLEDIPKTEGLPRLAIHLDNTNREISEGLFEGDIVLTPEQKLLLQQRKATQWAMFWPKDSSGTVTVGYRFGDNVINRTKLKVAITQWEQNTCIRFKEVTSTVGYAHLIFVDSTTGCASYVGRIASMTTGQRVLLHSSCVNEIGPVVHEIGHALGFFHEQSRSDRDDYVKIMLANVQSGSEHNFPKHVTFNYGVPYDYSSVMHYGPTDFSANNENTISALNPRAQPLMGNRVGLTFADKLLANAMYGCLDQWLTKCSRTSDWCQNLGYTGPDCYCVCPEGTSGERCEVLQNSYTEALIKKRTPYSEIITTPGVVSTPGYPTPIQNRTAFVKVLVAPACHNVILRVGDFQMYPRNTDSTCTVDALTIRTSDTLGSGKKYCGTEIATGTVFISGNNTIVLDYFNYDYTSGTPASPYRGFTATIEHISIPGCTTTTPPPTPTTGPPSVTFFNSGSTLLIKLSSSTGSCILGDQSAAGYYELTSGGYPNSYSPWDGCNLKMETSEPRYLRVTATEMKTGPRDAVVVLSLFEAGFRLTSAEAGHSFTFMSASAHIYFRGSIWWFGRRYKLTINVLNTDCHQIVRVRPGAPETLAKTNYTVNTICEWWIQAPPGKQIKLDFSAFKIGQFDCSSDYMVIDTSGDKRYEIATQKYCGRNNPGSVTSTGGQLNVILNGFQGGSPGFTATYTVV